MSKYLNLIFLFSFSFFLVTIFSNCTCNETVFDYTGKTDMTSELLDEQGEVLGTSSRITEAFQFKVLFEVIVINTNDGLDCGSRFDSQIDETTFVLTSDRPFTFDGNQVETGTNIFNLADIRYGITNTDLIILIEQDFLDRADFEMDVDYLFDFSVDTNKGSQLSGDIVLTFLI